MPIKNIGCYIKTARIFCREADMSGKKDQGRSRTAPARGYRLRAKHGRQARILQRANRQVITMAAAVIIVFFAAIILQALLT
ncbi:MULTISPECIES: hypothetical protein [Rhizobium]|uniref:Uncharacterized protein n=1 Tax=Rhizobium paranaense TaxID=1650438 RepID=A0A7W8XX55_9HYPH|nr:hypothetical protein [Rhizobium paranaense]MBB5577198.1 hypothetical protein [Rhizobium paranaense]